MSSTNHPRTPLTGGRKRRHAMRAFKSKIKRVLWDSKRRKIVTIVSTIALVAATGAAAFFVLSVSGTASQDQTLGNSGNIALAGVRVTGFDANHMVPGDTTSIQVYASNPSGQTAQVSSIDYAVTSTAAGFDPAWFQVTPTSGLPVVMPNGHDTLVGTADVKFVNTASDQSAIAGQPITITATLH